MGSKECGPPTGKGVLTKKELKDAFAYFEGIGDVERRLAARLHAHLVAKNVDLDALRCLLGDTERERDEARDIAKIMVTDLTTQRDEARAELAKHCLDEACCDGASDLPRVTAENAKLRAVAEAALRIPAQPSAAHRLMTPGWDDLQEALRAAGYLKETP